LTVSGASYSSFLGAASGQGVQLGDVTGDGVLDVVATTQLASVGNSNTGAIYLWKGGAALAGPAAPSATEAVPGAAADDQLGN
jgi:hypothetical protein